MPKIVDHEARRREISAAAAALIAKGGLEAVTFREIAQASGYSKGVVEHYFENVESYYVKNIDLPNGSTIINKGNVGTQINGGNIENATFN